MCGRVGRAERGGGVHQPGMTAAAAAEPPVRVDNSDSLDDSGDLASIFRVGQFTNSYLVWQRRGPHAYVAECGVPREILALRRLHRLPGGGRSHAPPGGPPARFPNLSTDVDQGEVQDGLGVRVEGLGLRV